MLQILAVHAWCAPIATEIASGGSYVVTAVAQVREDVKTQAAALAAQTEILRTLTDLARRQTVAMESLVRLNRTSCMNTANLAKDKEAAQRECIR